MVTTTTRFPSRLWEEAASMAVRFKTSRQKLAAEGLAMRLAQLRAELDAQPKAS